MKQILRLFPLHMREAMEKSGIFRYPLEEIRVRVNAVLTFRTAFGDFFLKEDQPVKEPDADCLRAGQKDLEQICMLMSEYSLYAWEEEIRQGFLTVEGGHRIGVCGQVSCEEGRIRRIFPILYLNIRIAHERRGCARAVLPYLMEKSHFCSTLLLSAPGLGKTTLLRDLVRLLSEGTETSPAKTVALVDERSEIAGGIRGIPQNDVGRNTDVLDGCPKSEGMMLMLRSMSPQVLAVDEIGGNRDLKALEYASFCGCRILASVHASACGEVWERPGWENCRKSGLFTRFVEIRKQEGRRIYRVFDREGACLFAEDGAGPQKRSCR